MLTAESPEVVEFIAAYQENKNLAHSWRYVIVATARRKYLAIDEADDNGDGTPSEFHRSGRFMVDRETGAVYMIRGYGQRGDRIGTLEGLAAKYREGTATFNPNARAHLEGRRDHVAVWPKHLA